MRSGARWCRSDLRAEPAFVEPSPCSAVFAFIGDAAQAQPSVGSALRYRGHDAIARHRRQLGHRRLRDCPAWFSSTALALMLASTVQGPSRWPGAYASAGRPSTESRANGAWSPAITPSTTTSVCTAPGTAAVPAAGSPLHRTSAVPAPRPSSRWSRSRWRHGRQGDTPIGHHGQQQRRRQQGQHAIAIPAPAIHVPHHRHVRVRLR